METLSKFVLMMSVMFGFCQCQSVIEQTLNTFDHIADHMDSAHEARWQKKCAASDSAFDARSRQMREDFDKRVKDMDEEHERRVRQMREEFSRDTQRMNANSRKRQAEFDREWDAAQKQFDREFRETEERMDKIMEKMK